MQLYTRAYSQVSQRQETISSFKTRWGSTCNVLPSLFYLKIKCAIISVFQGFILSRNHDAYKKQWKQKPFRDDNSKGCSLVITKNYYPCYVPYILLSALHVWSHLTVIRIPWSGMLLLIPVYKTLGTKWLIWQRSQEIEKIKFEFLWLYHREPLTWKTMVILSVSKKSGEELAVGIEVSQVVLEIFRQVYGRCDGPGVVLRAMFPNHFFNQILLSVTIFFDVTFQLTVNMMADLN